MSSPSKKDYKKLSNLYTTNKKFRKQDVADARRWFAQKIKELGNPNKVRGRMSDTIYRGKLPLIGRMVYFTYSAKYKDVLPYWDRQPLSIMIDENSTHYLGLNLHYLPPKQRILLLRTLFDLLVDTKFETRTYLKVSYPVLKATSKYRMFRPTLHSYIKTNIRSKIGIVRPTQWHKAILLPTAKFVGASSKEVWADSMRIGRG